MARVTWCLGMITAIAAAGCGKDDRDGGPRTYSESKSAIARLAAKKLALEAYPRWAMKPSNEGRCPTVSDLAEYIAQEPGFTDPWGRPYVVRCGAELPPGVRGIAVLSLGPDGEADTGDDVRAWER